MPIELDELPAHERFVRVLLQVLADFVHSDFGRPAQDFIELVELLEQADGGLRPDLRHARHIVNGVTDERLVIDHLIGPNAPVGHQTVSVVVGVFADVVELHQWADELPRVFVIGDDERVDAALLSGVRERREDVVGLPTFLLKDRNPEGFDDSFDHCDLRPQLVGHLGAVGFVVGVDVLTNAATGRVHRTDQIGRMLRLQNVEHVPREPEDRVCRLPRWTRHSGNRVKDLIHETENIDGVKGFAH